VDRNQLARLARVAVASGVLAGVILAGGPTTAAQRIHEVALPTPQSGPYGITRGPGGTMWFTESFADAIGVVRRDGSVHEFALPAGSTPQQIVEGPDGNLWFTMFGANAVGRMTPTGHLRTFTVPKVDSGPFGIAVGPDGNLWITEAAANIIGRVTPTGAFTQFQLNLGFDPESITAGPDGAMWFTRFSNPEKEPPGFIGRITTSGSVTQARSDGVQNPLGIVTGPDGNLWVTGTTNDVVAKVSTNFEITTFPVPGGALNVPYMITVGPDRALWFTENGLSEGFDSVAGNKIGRITTDGTIHQLTVPTPSSHPSAIAPGPNGTLWFAEQAGGKLGHLSATG
jgi:virginiamycin B lyase